MKRWKKMKSATIKIAHEQKIRPQDEPMQKQPNLDEINIEDVNILSGVIITIGPGQWDSFIAAGYDQGFTLLEIIEVEGMEVATRAFKKKTGTPQ